MLENSHVRPFTYQDYLQIPDEPGFRYEVLEGMLVKDSAPSLLHQYVAQILFEIIKGYFTAVDPGGLAFFAPVDVTLGNTTVVQPDIIFISSRQKQIIQYARVDGAPTLAVEITSPSTRSKDSRTKLQIYDKARVQHYWLLNPEDQTFQTFSLRGNSYILVTSGVNDDIITHPDLPGLKINLHDLWNMT